MLPAVVEVKIRWQGVQGATAYEVWKDGVKVGSRGPRARTARVLVDSLTDIEVVDVPSRGSQKIHFGQESG